MQVNAVEKKTGKSQKITITNDKGRLSKDDIDRMVKEAERYAEQDKASKEKIEAKNHLESFAYQMRNTLNKEAVKAKIEEADKKKITDAIDTTLKWLEDHATATKEEIEAKSKELEDIVQPIMVKFYQQGGTPNMGGGMPPNFNPEDFAGGNMPNMGNFNPQNFAGGNMPNMGNFNPQQNHPPPGTGSKSTGPTVDEVD